MMRSVLGGDMGVAKLASRQGAGAFPFVPIVEADKTFQIPARVEHGCDRNLSITLTGEPETREAALDLVNRRYAWRGYGANQKLSGRRSETTFTARADDELVGTITLVADSERGLAVDQTFPSEMQYFRRKPNAVLCELKKFAVDCVDPSKPVLASLFHFVFIYGTTNFLGTDLLIEVNPRHVFFYERMLGFERVGGLKVNPQVNAPSQLMWLSVAKIADCIANGEADAQRRSLYAYFFSRELEQSIANELLHTLD